MSIQLSRVLLLSDGHAKALRYIESFHPREEGER